MPEGYRKEYAEFIELAVHELDTPLRKLSVWFDKISTSSNLGEEETKYLPRITVCINEMRSLINSLSNLAAFNIAERANAPVNLTELVKKIAEDYPLLQEAGALTVSELPVLEGDPAQYELLFRNLLENAVRFRKNGTIPKVKIEASILPEEEGPAFLMKQDTAYYRITVSDEGIGFKPQFATDIFKPFVRLRGRAEFPGNGIGLALCKKIVENHEGIIYAEGLEKQGARIILILPISLN
jgi:signal transduction histidine kinase